MEQQTTVTFVGAGPGHPGLLTILGRDAIASADLVLYAGSLVPPQIVQLARPGAQVVDSALLTLEESHALVAEYARKSGLVARVHTGDPSLYGALREQIALLERDGISWKVIPGVTAACAAAAAAGLSFTTPGIAQSLVITRQAGRTPMPAQESLGALASHHTSLAVYLSGKLARQVQEELATTLAPDTPILCAQRVGWPDEKIVWTKLFELADCVAQNNLQRQCVFLVLPGQSSIGRRSCLYSPDFAHLYRPGAVKPE